MVAFVFSIIIALLAVAAFFVGGAMRRAYKRDGDSFYGNGGVIAIVGGFVGLIGAALLLLFGSVIVSNGVGEAKVYTNPDGTIAFTQTTPGFQSKAPWQDYADFDLFSQEVLYASTYDGGTPAYAGGTVSGAEVTVSVGGVNGGSTQANLDISVTYSLDADEAEDIYTKYKSQERFTKQIIEKTILATIRQIPSAYTAVEFRGDKRGEAADRILAALNDKLNQYGVTVDFVNLQDIRYPENVEQSLADVEAANQQALKAEADLRAAEVKAQQKVVEAQATADANAILDASLTPNVLTSQYYNTLKSIGEGGNLVVVPSGSTPLVNVSK